MACAGSSWPRREHWPLEAKLFFPPSYVYCLSFLFPPFLYGLRKLHAVAGPLVLDCPGTEPCCLLSYLPAYIPSYVLRFIVYWIYTNRFPESKGEQWPSLFPSCTTRAEIKLVDSLIRYNPAHRLTAAQVNNLDFYR